MDCIVKDVKMLCVERATMSTVGIMKPLSCLQLTISLYVLVHIV